MTLISLIFCNLKKVKKSEKSDKKWLFWSFFDQKKWLFDDFWWSKKVKKMTFFENLIIIFDLRKNRKKWLFFENDLDFSLFWSKKVKKSDFLWSKSHFLFKKIKKLLKTLFFLIFDDFWWPKSDQKWEMNEIFDDFFDEKSEKWPWFLKNQKSEKKHKKWQKMTKKVKKKWKKKHKKSHFFWSKIKEIKVIFEKKSFFFFWKNNYF